MVKKIIAVATTILMLCCMVPLSAFADTHTHTFGDNKRGIDMSSLPDDYYCPVTFYETPCSELCGYSKYEWSFGARSESFVDVTGLNPLQVYAHWHTWFEKAYGAGANLKQYETGGGSAGTGGAGRRPSGYLDDAGTPTYNADGNLILLMSHDSSCAVAHYDYLVWQCEHGTGTLSSSYKGFFDVTQTSCVIPFTLSSNRISSSKDFLSLKVKFRATAPVTGYYTVPEQVIGKKSYAGYWSGNNVNIKVSKYRSSYTKGATIELEYSHAPSLNAYNDWDVLNFTRAPYLVCEPALTTINQQTNITINNNTWNGNIYQDNSTNLTYIYPQYTTINENNETVTNISNNPIIYNNETKEYYTYDSVTNNYYYITYVTETPTPTPSPDPTPTPDPGTDPTPTPTPGGDTGDTTGILAVLVEIRDNMVQGFADIKATLVQGWADLSANFTLAIENLNLNITNIFNKKFPDQSTPETAEPSPSPSPSPEPSPSPTPDPGETPTPTPAPTDKPSGGNTNNFWNFVFPGGNDDGTENGHKGILWALISLLIAVVTFVLGLGSAYSYVFPFLPAGLVTTIHICVLVLLLFAIIKFVRSFL